MAARRAKPVRMEVRRGWAAAAAEAVVSLAIVVATAWYSVARSDDLDEWLADFAPAWAGLLTLAVVLVAGGLLAHAFGRAEDAVQGWRQAHQVDLGADH